MSSSNLDNRNTEDDDPTSQIRPWCVPIWLLWVLSIIAAMLSCLSFWVSLVLWYRNFNHNKQGIIAAALIGLLLLSAGISSALIAINQKREPETFKTEDSLKSSKSLRIAALFVSLFTFACAIGMLWSGFHELNRDYLNWFGNSNQFSYAGSRIDKRVWNDLIIGEFFFFLTIFFWWFALFKGKSRSDLLMRYIRSRQNEEKPE